MRADDLGGVDHAAQSALRAVPALASNIFEVGQMDFMPISTSMPELFGAPPHLAQIFRFQTADETDLGEVDDFGFAARRSNREVEKASSSASED